MATTVETTKELVVNLYDADGQTSSFKLANPKESLPTDTTLIEQLTDLLLGDPQGTEADNMFAVKGTNQPTAIKLAIVETTTTTFVDTKGNDT